MQKTITVYVVSNTTTEKTVTFGTRSQAEKAVDLLERFGIESNLEQSKKTVNIDE